MNNAVQFSLYMACFGAIGMPVTVYQALFYNSVSWIATVVSIVPGNIGIKEAVMGVATSLTGVVSERRGRVASAAGGGHDRVYGGWRGVRLAGLPSMECRAPCGVNRG